MRALVRTLKSTRFDPGDGTSAGEGTSAGAGEDAGEYSRTELRGTGELAS